MAIDDLDIKGLRNTLQGLRQQANELRGHL